MEAVYKNKHFNSDLNLKEVIASFFGEHTPESAKVIFWKMFQCWVIGDCNIKADFSDEEIALFLDQLIDLVAAAYVVHQANRAPLNNQEVKNNA